MRSSIDASRVMRVGRAVLILACDVPKKNVMLVHGMFAIDYIFPHGKLLSSCLRTSLLRDVYLRICQRPTYVPVLISFPRKRKD